MFGKNKIMGLVFAISCFMSLTSGMAYATDYIKIKGCHGCTEAQNSMAAKSLFPRKQGGQAYIVDYTSRTYVKYQVYVEWIDTGDRQVPALRTKLLSMENSEISSLDKLFSLIDDLQYEISSTSFVDPSQVQAKAASPTSAGIALATLDVGYSVNGDNAYDFIRTSKMRNEMYQAHLAGGINRFAVGLNAVTDALNLGAINLKELKLHIVLRFEGGSSVKVYPNFLTETYDIIPDTARDADGNTIPMTRAEAIGDRFIFTTTIRRNLFNNYLGAWAFRSVELQSSCSRTATICSVANGEVVCNTSCL